MRELALGEAGAEAVAHYQAYRGSAPDDTASVGDANCFGIHNGIWAVGACGALGAGVFDAKAPSDCFALLRAFLASSKSALSAAIRALSIVLGGDQQFAIPVFPHHPRRADELSQTMRQDIMMSSLHQHEECSGRTTPVTATPGQSALRQYLAQSTRQFSNLLVVTPKTVRRVIDDKAVVGLP